MNPIKDPNEVFSHDAIKYVYQESDMRKVNPTDLKVKPFKDSEKKIKKEDKKKQKDKNKDDPSGLFDLF